MKRNRRRWVRVVCALGAVTVSPSALADTGDSPTVPVPPAAQVEESPSWDAAYAQARAALLRGEFELARSSFESLAQTARTPSQRTLSAELAGLAKGWAEGGLTLTRSGHGGLAKPGDPPSNQRTTDEISILYLNAVVYGLGTGLWLDSLTEPNNAAGAILPALGLAGAAAGAVALIDHSTPLGYGVPASAVSGMYIGLEEGITWSLWNQAKAAYYDEWQAKTVATVIWGSASVGAITGAVVGASAGTTPGRASYVGSSALWGGLLTGLVVASATGNERGQRDDASLLGAALGTNVGALAGVFSAGTVSPSVARVRFIDLGGIAGGLVAGGLYISAANNLSEQNTQGFLGVTALGIAGGLALSAVLTKNMPADRGRTFDDKPTAFNLQPTLIPVRGGTLIGARGAF